MAGTPDEILAAKVAEFEYDPLGHALFMFPWDQPGPLAGQAGPRSWQGNILKTISSHLKNPLTRFQPLRIAVASGHGTGKALAHGEPVLTIMGWLPVEAIAPGMQVIAADGRPTTVLAVYPQGVRDLLRVTLNDGCSVVVDGSHQWLTASRGERKHGKPASIKTTREIAATLTFPNGQRPGLNHQLPTLEPVEHPSAALPIEPYLFGCWLGDGDAQGRITGEADGFEQLEAADAATGSPVMKAGGKAHCRTMLGISRGLRALGMFGCRSHEKTIPSAYLHASIAQRIALLQGLLDTDGTVGKGNAVVFDVTASGLAEGVSEIVRSLGGVARRSEKWGSYGGKRCRRVYRVFISLPRGIAPFRLPRKAARYQPQWGSRNCDRTRRRYIAGVEPAGRGEATCITVDHPSHLFVTRDHIVTHNSAQFGMLTKWALDCHPGARIVLTANTEQQVVTKTSPEVSKWHKMALTEHWFKRATMKIASLDDPENWRLDFVTWSENNTEAFAGLHNLGKLILVGMDEGSNISDKVFEVTEGALTDENTIIIWIVFGNPTRNSGRFYECFHRYRHLWRTVQIDARDVEGTNKEYLQSIIDTYGIDSDIAKVRVLGQFPSASTMQFIGAGLVDAAQQREIVQSAILPGDPVIFGLDHARFGDDSSVLAIRQGRDARSRPWKRWNGADSMQIAGDVNSLMQGMMPDAIFIDAGGPNAGGVIDRLRQLNPEYRSIFEINFGTAHKEMTARGVLEAERVRVANKRAQMWQNMKIWLDRGVLPRMEESVDSIGQRIKDDLIGPEYAYTADQAILLEKKEHMKKRGLASPDFGDALALTFAEDVGPRSLPAHLDPANYGYTDKYDRYREIGLDAAAIKDYDRYSEL